MRVAALHPGKGQVRSVQLLVDLGHHQHVHPLAVGGGLLGCVDVSLTAFTLKMTHTFRVVQGVTEG